MDLSKIMSKENLDTYYSQLEKVKPAAGLRNELLRSKDRIKRLKLVEGATGFNILPLELALPFNPMNLGDITYNENAPFVFPGSVTNGLATLKMLMKRDPALKAQVMKTLHLQDESKLRLDSIDTHVESSSKDNDMITYAPFRRFKVYTDVVQTFHFSDSGKFGETHHCDATFDTNGNITNGGFGYQMHLLETALLTQKVLAIKESYESGENSSRPDAECKEKTDAIWKNRKISNPYVYGTARIIFFPTTPDYSLTQDTINKFKAPNNWFEFEAYMKIDGSMIATLKAYIGSDYYDNELDYICFNMQVPVNTNHNAATAGQNALKVSRQPTDGGRLPSVQIPDFDEKYRKLLDDPEAFKTEVMMRSVYNYKPIDDDSLASKYKNDLQEYHDILAHSAISQKFADVITEIDSNLSAETLANVASDTQILPAPTAAQMSEAPHLKQEDIPESEDEDSLATELTAAMAQK